MERELRHRYAHMVDLQDDLQRVEAGLPPLGPHGHRAPTTDFSARALSDADYVRSSAPPYCSSLPPASSSFARRLPCRNRSAAKP
jgi:hypothetical protein